MGSFFPLSDGSKNAAKFFPLSKEAEDVVNFLAENLKNLKFDDNGEMEEERSKKIDDARKLLDEMKRFIEGTTQQPEKEISKISSSSSVQRPRLLKKPSEFDMEADLLEGQMVANLQLSYDLLPVKLRLCSLFLAVFPENTIIEKKYLIYWWIGEGFITKTSTTTSEEAGEAAFKELIEKGIIEPHYRSLRSPVVSGCTVNPWTRRMLISMARKAVFFDFDQHGELTRYRSQTSHRAIKDQIDSSEEGELLTMYNMWGSYHRINPEFLSKIQKLRVLQLGRWQKNARRHIEIEDTKFLDKLWTQKQLKYLSLRGISRITTLPESIIGCQNLEILDLRACHNLEKLPSEIGSLRKLTHFIVSECYLLEGLPKGLEKMSSLEVLKGFVVNHWRKNPCSVSSLYELEKLRKLSISVGTSSKQERTPNPKKKSSSFVVQDVPSLNQPFTLGGIFTGYAFPKELRAENLRVLTIIWQMRSSTDKEEEEEEEESTAPFVSASLPKLEKLDLRCYPRKRLPQWILPANFRNLKRLYIRGGKLETLLPLSTSDAKWEIQILRLNYLKNFRLRQTFDMEKEFPNLLYFERTKCQLSSDGKFDADIEWRLEDTWKALKETLERDHRDRPQRIQTIVAAREEQEEEEEEEEEDGGGGGEQEKEGREGGQGRKKMKEDEGRKRKKKEGEEDKKRKEEGSSKKGKEEEEDKNRKEEETSRKGKEEGGGEQGRKKMEDEDRKRKKEGEEDKKRKEEGSSKKGKEEEEDKNRKEEETSRKGKEKEDKSARK